MNGGKIWLVIGALVAVVIIVIGWFAGASPLFKQADDAEVQRADVESNNQQLEVTLAKMKKLDDQKEDLVDRLEELRKTVPTVANLEDYLDWLAVAAGISAVSMPNVAVGAPQLVTLSDGAPAEFSDGLKQSLYLLPVNITIGGSPEQMAAFVKLLQSDGRLQLVNSISMNFGTSLTGSVEGYIFVVYDPSLGPLTSPADDSVTDPGAEEGAGGDESAEPAPASTPTPPPAG